MQFNSYTFAIFFALVLLVYASPIAWRAKKLVLLASSYLFYAAWNPPFVLLLWLSTVVDWGIAKRLAREDGRGARRALVSLSLGVNLGLLAVFKYGAFLVENFERAAASMGIEFQAAAPDLVLPVGISFYTFQTLSYTLDVYRRKTGPWHSFLDYALYVTFFPQLVAGPIVRSTTFLPQCDEPPEVSRSALGMGLCLLVFGLFLKVVMADGVFAPVAEAVFDSEGPFTPGFAWSGALAFSGQIYCDFAGYSLCAIGIAGALGFRLPKNFMWPYAAVGFSDFWRRWHISLSTWLRDYLYISLGGNRRGPRRTGLNLMVTMLIGGLWHGASWNFVLWGGLHGAFLVVERGARRLWPNLRADAFVGGRTLAALATFLIVSVAWVFFRAKELDRALEISGAMLAPWSVLELEAPSVALDFTHALSMASIALVFSVHRCLRNRELEELLEATPGVVRGLTLGAMLFLIATMSGPDRAFIYFQF